MYESKWGRPTGLLNAVMAAILLVASFLPLGAPGYKALLGVSQEVAHTSEGMSEDTSRPVLTEANAEPTVKPMESVSPESIGLNGDYLDDIDEVMEDGQTERQFPGAVVVVARDGAIAKHSAYGYEVLYDHQKQRLSSPVPASTGTIYDLASVTKLFTATAVMKLVEQGQVDLDAPVSQYIPEFAANGKEDITVRHLLTHTSGLPAGMSFGGVDDNHAAREQALYRVRAQSSPGRAYLYSDVNFMVLGKLVERVSGKTLDVFEREVFFQPLGMHDTMYNPPQELHSRIAATEVNPGPNRGVVRGEVHDGSAYALGGVAGNAGLFSTGHDLAVFGQMIANGGEYDGVRVLEQASVSELLKPQPIAAAGQRIGLGWELNQGWYMGDLTREGAVGHTGYTGTSLVVCPETRTVVVVLTNRVHPTASGSVNSIREAVATLVAKASNAAM